MIQSPEQPGLNRRHWFGDNGGIGDDNGGISDNVSKSVHFKSLPGLASRANAGKSRLPGTRDDLEIAGKLLGLGLGHSMPSRPKYRLPFDYVQETPSPCQQ
ncbi:hypothetical protein [Mesorhizobium sangaii]|uniref:Uncharacterized protein n=1 Tax=Mesorhizobium sangaii TaxID=505389 RepID=A0A841PLR0_9HYPH|nr:hypothetical protein [Mesorhizobium sangaii]MBB6411102.1 hypothetical protein [Mesorhizobium sangaii]